MWLSHAQSVERDGADDLAFKNDASAASKKSAVVQQLDLAIVVVRLHPDGVSTPGCSMAKA
jgi:hypothetical protein